MASTCHISAASLPCQISARKYRCLPSIKPVFLQNDVKVNISTGTPKSAGTDFIYENSPLVVTFGEMLIDFVPTSNGVSLAEAEHFKKAAGGAPANVAVGISRLGGKSAFIGKVGDDEFGHMLSAILADNNVGTSGVRFDKEARTALAFVTLKSNGEREFMFYRNPSADMMLTPNELDTDLIQSAGVFHFGSISLIAEPCRSAHLAALSIAKSSGSLISFDPNVRLPLWPSPNSAREAIFEVWSHADVIKVSDEELAFLLESSDPLPLVKSFFHDSLKLLVITEGASGARYYTKNFDGQVGGFKVSVEDTTGAGDAFVAGLLTRLASNKSVFEDESSLRDSIRFANACGAMATTGRGAIPSLPSLKAVVDFMASVAAVA